MYLRWCVCVCNQNIWMKHCAQYLAIEWSYCAICLCVLNGSKFSSASCSVLLVIGFWVTVSLLEIWVTVSLLEWRGLCYLEGVQKSKSENLSPFENVIYYFFSWGSLRPPAGKITGLNTKLTFCALTVVIACDPSVERVGCYDQWISLGFPPTC